MQCIEEGLSKVHSCVWAGKKMGCGRCWRGCPSLRIATPPRGRTWAISWPSSRQVSAHSHRVTLLGCYAAPALHHACLVLGQEAADCSCLTASQMHDVAMHSRPSRWRTQLTHQRA